MFVYIEVVAAFAAVLLLSRIVTGVQGERRYRRATVFIGVLLVCVALTILTIGARSPYTHANLSSGYDLRYERTDQVLVGEPGEFRGLSQKPRPAGTDPIALGTALYLTTERTLVGAPGELRGPSRNAEPAGTDPIARGAALYVTAGCVSCHALEGRGGVVGRPIAGADEETIMQRVRRGPTGMPQFSTAVLADEDIRDIAAYLRSLAAR
ncbi:MAG: cytochrome c [Candidatus Limnocylindria bacterium]|nr:cytochrome c [Candidatus Limnocylindria bacterium]